MTPSSPGLINTHVHLSRGGMFGPVEPVSPRQIALNLHATLLGGVTTAVDLGCTAPMIRALRSLSEHDSAFPEIRAAGPLVTAPKGYPIDWVPRVYARMGVALPCANDEDAARAVNRITEAGMRLVRWR